MNVKFTTKNNCSLQLNSQVLRNAILIMNSSKRTQKDGDLNAVSDIELARTAEFSVFFLYNEGIEVATILGGESK